MERLLSRRRAILAAGLAVSIVSPLHAEDRFWQGGASWQTPSAWAGGVVPTGDDTAVLPSSVSGNVFLNGIAIVDALRIEGRDYNVTGSLTSQLHANYIHFGGQENLRLTVPVIVGRSDYYNDGRAVLEISGDGYGIDVSSVITGPGNAPFDAWLEGTYRNQIAGVRDLNVVFGEMTLTGNGFLQDPTNIFVDHGTLRTDNTDNPSGRQRLSDNSKLRLDKSRLAIGTWDNNTHVEALRDITVGRGTNTIEMQWDTRLRVGGAGTIHRDADSRGTLRIEGDGVLEGPIGLGSAITYYNGSEAQHFVPWMSRNGRPIEMNYGPDNIPGNGDDDGPREVTTDLWIDSNNASHVYMYEDHTLAGGSNPQRRSLTMENGTTLNLNAGTLDLESGVLIANGNVSLAGNTGSVRSINGREMIVHLYGFDSTLQVQSRLISPNGVTFAGPEWFGAYTVRLENQNTITGPVVANNVKLELATNNAIPATSTLRLVESSLKLDFNGGNFDTPITFDSSSQSRFSGAGILYDLQLKDNYVYTATGLWQGKGPIFVHGNNSVLRYNNTQTPTTSGDLSLWPRAGVTLEVNGNLGDRSLGQDGAIILFEGTLAGSGRVTGIQASGGVIAPGTNAGNNVGSLRTHDLSVIGSLFRFQLNGTGFGTGHDGIDASGFAYFTDQSTFQTVSSSFVAQIGQQFDLVRYAFHYVASTPQLSISQAVQSGGQWIHYFDHDSFTIAVAGPTGDATLDGTVNFDDLLVLAQNYGQSGRNWLTGDFNYDGNVNFDDLLILAQRYGQSALTDDVTAANFEADWALALSMVPEPSTLTASLLVIPLLQRRRSRAAN